MCIQQEHLPPRMSRNAIALANCITNDTSKKRKCLLLRDVVNALNVQVPIPGDVSVGVVDNVTPVEPLLDFDDTADWDDANATDDETMPHYEFVHTKIGPSRC